MCKSQGGPFVKRKIEVAGLPHPVTIVGDQLKIGCETHRISDWVTFTARDLIRMGGKNAVREWRVYGPALVGLTQANMHEITMAKDVWDEDIGL